MKATIIVTDASPLITLGAADALRILMLPQLPIVIPDMVHFEVARDMSRLGAREVADFINGNRDLVRIAATETYAEFVALLSLNPGTRSRGRGEQATAEVLQDEISRDAGATALLLYEDRDLESRTFKGTLPERVGALSTGEFLAELQKHGLIQSLDQILDEAERRGRTVGRLRNNGQEWLSGNQAGRPEILKAVLETTRDAPDHGSRPAKSKPKVR